MKNVLLVVLVALLLVPFEAEAGKRRHRAYRWDADRVIVVENRMGPEWNAAVEFVVASWHQTFPRLWFRVEHRPPGKRCRRAEGRIVLCERRQPVGLAWVEHDRRQITAVRIYLSAHPPYDGLEMWSAQRAMSDLHALCHEFGHALGLTHSGGHLHDQSCVAYRAPRITPGPYDAESLRLLYTRTGPGWP